MFSFFSFQAKEKIKQTHPSYSPDADNQKIEDLLEHYKNTKNNAEARAGHDDFIYPLPHNAYDIGAHGPGPIMWWMNELTASVHVGACNVWAQGLLCNKWIN